MAEAFCDDLHKLGFDLVGETEERGQFTFIRALKAAREPQAELKLKFQRAFFSGVGEKQAR